MKNFSLWSRVLFLAHSVAQADSKLMIYLPQSPKCWDYRLEPPHLAHEEIFNWWQWGQVWSLQVEAQESATLYPGFIQKNLTFQWTWLKVRFCVVGDM
jgi:hypothetical protein